MQQRDLFLINKIFKSYWIASVLAAVNLAMPLMQFIVTFYFLIGGGSVMLMAIASGRGSIGTNKAE